MFEKKPKVLFKVPCSLKGVTRTSWYEVKGA